MSTEITTTGGSPEITAPSTSTGASLGEWAADLDHAYKIAQAVCVTKFVPKELQGKPEETAVRMLAGQSLGIDPMSSMSAFYEVHNRPALYARTMIAVAQAKGHQFQRTEATNDRVVYRARRRGDQEWQTFEWDISRAKQAGYLSNDKYKTDPIGMLTAKAQAEAARVIAPDALMGMVHSVEDLQLEDLGEVEDAPKTTVKRKPRAKAEPKPTAKKTEEPAQAEEPDEPEPTETPEDQPAQEQSEPISQQTWDEIKDLLKEKAPGESPGPWAMRTIGRTVKKWAEFTQAEGDQMLELLISGELGEQAEAA